MSQSPKVSSTSSIVETPLVQGNRVFRTSQFSESIRHYVQVLLDTPALGKTIATNMAMAKQKYRTSRKDVKKPSVAVCGWELSHNAAGRVYTLAQLYQTFADTEIIGSFFPKWGRDLWEPIRGTSIPVHSFVVEDEKSFLDQAVQLVAAHPYDIVHLSKPRISNIFIGILYKLIWDAKVLVDIDDEELAFVGEDSPISVDEYVKNNGSLPALIDLAGKDWTRLAVGLAKEFDGVTVSNPALQQRYGGEIIRHARDEKQLQPSLKLKNKSREKFGVPQDAKVVLFLGTPRKHKGLEQIADAISILKRSDLTFVIVGDFCDTALKSKLEAKKDVKYIFIGNQPFDNIDTITAIGDYCILQQDLDSPITRFQIPAKLTDAFASSLTVIANNCPPIADIVEAGALVPIKGNLSETLLNLIEGKIAVNEIQKSATRFYQEEMTLSINGKRLEKLIASLEDSTELKPKLLATIKNVPSFSPWQVSDIVHLIEKLKKNKQHLAAVRHKILPETPPRANTEKQDSPPRQPSVSPPKLPITVLIITWDVGHNPLGRSYMLAEVVQRIARHSLIIGFQFPRYGDAVWEPVRHGKLPVITMPGSNLPEFHESLQNIAQRIRPDVVIACKPRLPSVELGMMIKEQWGCPLIIDVDDHELSFFKHQTELQISDLAAMPIGSAAQDTEPYAEIWTRLAQSLCKSADEIIVSNIALQREFGGTIVPHVRDENTFNPAHFNGKEVRRRYGIPAEVKVVLFFGTPRVHKGVDTLAAAVSQITDPDFRLLVVGTTTDRRVTAMLDSLAPGRVIYLPNQPFSAIPEIMSMADVVCLPQDEGHAISQYQLPAKAIDAIAMGVPLLVSNTPPLMQLVNDQVAELVELQHIPEALQRLGGDPSKVNQWRSGVRSRFLERYSYAAAALQMKELIQRSMARKQRVPTQSTAQIIEVSRHVLGVHAMPVPKVHQSGIDIVLFWKQNDTGLYGRRHDMVIKYLASRSDVRKVVVFDAPSSEFDLIKRQEATGDHTQDRWIYVGTYEKLMGLQDTEKISYNVFVYPPGKYRTNESDVTKAHMHEGYLSYIQTVLNREGVEAHESIFWVYPKNFSAPELIKQFKPRKVVVDVVDDHRAWPNTSEAEKKRLTDNYRETLALADMAFTNCEPVQQSMKEFFPDIRLVPNGCDSTPPAVTPKNSPEYDAFCSWTGKTIGYIGNLESKIDIELLDKLAMRFPDCQLVLIGSTHANPAVLQLKRHPNVRMPGVVPYREAGAWVSRFDVGLVPHLNLALTQNMNPLKVFVYLAFNVPVVSNEIFNIERENPFIHIASNHEDFIFAIQEILGGIRQKTFSASDYVKTNDWSSRLSSHIDILLTDF